MYNKARIKFGGKEMGLSVREKTLLEVAKRLDRELDSGENTPSICKNIHFYMKELYTEVLKKEGD